MSGTPARRRLKSPWYTVPLLGALLCRALIPLGFMPGPGGLQLCPGYAPLPAISALVAPSHDAAAHHHHHHRSGQSGDDAAGDDPGLAMGHAGMGVCPFTGAATLIAGGHHPVLLTTYSLITAYVPDIAAIPLPRDHIDRSHLPRGPPALA